jgi:hypothetical protein
MLGQLKYAVTALGGSTLAGWIFMKAMEGPQERLRTELSDKKRGTLDKTVDNETELMVKMLRVGGEASLRLKKIQLTTGFPSLLQ